MNWPIDMLLQAPLFRGFGATELQELLAALAPRQRRVEKGETLLMAGEEIQDIGVVLTGEIEAAKNTRSGGHFTVARMGPGGVFADVLSGGHSSSPVTVTARSRCTVMLLSYPRLLSAPGCAPAAHRRLLANLIAVISDKYFSLDRRVDLLLIRGLRRRIAAYLWEAGGEAGRQGEAFSIPFTRAALAGYLGCERSALSREISRMAADGLLESDRTRFRLCRLAEVQALL